MIKKIPLSLYIHFPWCIKKCYYCDFNSHSLKYYKNYQLYKKYLLHLINDLKQTLSLINESRKINTIFIGGGTPSLVDNSLIKILIYEIKTLLNLSNKIEITIEVNPSTAEAKKFSYYKNIGINRLSIGMQTFNNKYLKNLGRTHSKQDSLFSAILAKKIFNNFNIDIMYGLPNQSIEEALIDLHYVIMINPQHISWYQLTIENNTKFSCKPPVLPHHEKIWDIYKIGNKLLQNYGYKNYEISSYAKKNYFCKHNYNYWIFGDYIGIGAGSHSKITKKNGNILRFSKINNPYIFMSGKYINKFYTVKDNQKPFEFFMNRLRLNKKILKKDFIFFTGGIHYSFINIQINKAIKKGYLKENLYYWNTTKKGRLFLNDLLEIFLY